MEEDLALESGGIIAGDWLNRTRLVGGSDWTRLVGELDKTHGWHWNDFIGNLHGVASSQPIRARVKVRVCEKRVL